MKFKVFDKEKKEFVDPCYLLLSMDGILIERTITGHSTHAKDNLIPVFSTGQKDIAGVEIYEGDVLEWDDGKGHVFFKNGCWFVKNFHNWSFDYPTMPFMEHTDFKIIGSKYTSP